MPKSRISVKGVARSARAADARMRKAARKTTDSVTGDSYQNFLLSLGIGTNSALSASTYGFNPITRERTLLEWMHRGSWLGGIAVDLIADDMTRAGVDISGKLKPEDIEKVEKAAVTIGIWEAFNDNIRWSRLYGGSIGVYLIEGQDPQTPLRLETVGKGQFLGIQVLDRWMVEPSLENLITEPGPNLGLPKFYRVVADAPALRLQTIHYSRCFRMDGIRLPYWQRVQENLWGISILERLFDRMSAFDAGTTGAAQLVHKSFIRTLKMKGLRAALATGGVAAAGVMKHLAMLRRLQSNESISLIDSDDEMTIDSSSGYAGISDVLLQLGQQLSGALQIPLVRMFGQSPAGLNSTGESDLRTYYDGIKQQQKRHLTIPATFVYKLLLLTLGIRIPDDFAIEFRSLWQMTEKERAETALTTVQAVSAAVADGTVDIPTAMKELRQSSEETGIFTNISDLAIKTAELEPPPMPGELEAQAAAVSGPARQSTVPAAQAKAQQMTGKEDEGKGGAKEDDEGDKAKPRFKVVSSKDHAGHNGTHYMVGSLPVTIETAKGEIRQPYGSTMPADYGYIDETASQEPGEAMDCFVGPNVDSPRVWVVHQRQLDTDKFDEHKCMLGYDSAMQALGDYVNSFNDGRGLERIMKVDQMSMPAFDNWLNRWRPPNGRKEAEAAGGGTVSMGHGGFRDGQQPGSGSTADGSGPSDEGGSRGRPRPFGRRRGGGDRVADQTTEVHNHFEESKHPRQPSGTSKGGEFAPKGTGGGSSFQHGQPSKANQGKTYVGSVRLKKGLKSFGFKATGHDPQGNLHYEGASGLKIIIKPDPEGAPSSHWFLPATGQHGFGKKLLDVLQKVEQGEIKPAQVKQELTPPTKIDTATGVKFHHVLMDSGYSITTQSSLGLLQYKKNESTIVVTPESTWYSATPGKLSKVGQGPDSLKLLLSGTAPVGDPNNPWKTYSGTLPGAPQPVPPPPKPIEEHVALFYELQKATVDPDQKPSAAQAYKGTGYMTMNDCLRQKEDCGPDVKAMQNWLGKQKLPKEIMVYRGIKANAAKVLMSVLMEGSIIKERGFMSTSTSAAFSKSWAANQGAGGMLMKIKCPKGSPGAVISGSSDSENEVVFNSGQTLKITGYDRKTHTVEAELVLSQG